VLLTGASGLLGRFVLARLLASGREVAVLVRPTHSWTASQRIEEALTPSEQQAWLQRPRMLEGDLNDDGLALGDKDHQWLSQRPIEVLHCAASIRFQCDSASGEPYRTNVDGTRNLLEVCRRLDVRSFHYVSTAYVGCRIVPTAGKVNEVVVADVASGGNDYEKSKIEAEQLIARCPYIGDKTIHRPSIIVGDSQSSFTSTYHGFYAPLQIGYQLAKHYGFSAEAGQWFRQQLGLQPEDSKNLVPVDWVAEAIVRTVNMNSSSRAPTTPVRPRILHWTNPHPVPCALLQECITTAIEYSSSDKQSAQAALTRDKQTRDNPSDEIPLSGDFREQMQVYESYFRSDPDFDNRQSRALLPDLPCPVVDRAMLLRLARYAIEQNFGWPKPLPETLPHQSLVATLRHFPLSSGPCESQLVLRLLGPGAPETLAYGRQNQSWCLLPAAAIPLPISASGTLTAPLSLLADCLSGKTNLPLAIEQGYCIMEGCLPQECLALAEHWVHSLHTSLC
jgi:nucleoside-diphosphate-sugar epimerase